MVYQDRLKTYLLQLLTHPETLEWFSVISVIIFKVNIVAAQKQALLVKIFLFFKAFISLNAFTSSYPTAVSASLEERAKCFVVVR